MENAVQYYSLPYILKIIEIKLIKCHYKDLLANYFGINKIHKMVAKKYYWATFCKDMKAYV